MIKRIYSRAFNIIGRLPVRLWGISLLSGLLALIIAVLGVNVPIIAIPITAALGAGLADVYFKVYNGADADTKTLLSPFSDLKTFAHVAGGMCWMGLWILLWLIIPIAGPVIAVIKSLSYAFTPYILLEEKTVSATDALKQSMQNTKGYKLNMFVAIVLPVVAFVVLSAIFSLLALIPYVGIVFAIISTLISLVYGLFAPMFLGLVKAGFYEYGKKPAKKTAVKSITAASAISGTAQICPSCGKENSSAEKFCKKCGAKL